MFKFIKSFFSSNNSIECTLITKEYKDYLESSVKAGIKDNLSLKLQAIDFKSKVIELESELLKLQLQNLELKIQNSAEKFEVMHKNIEILKLNGVVTKLCAIRK